MDFYVKLIVVSMIVLALSGLVPELVNLILLLAVISAGISRASDLAGVLNWISTI